MKILFLLLFPFLLNAQTEIKISFSYVSGFTGGCAFVINGEDNPVLNLTKGNSYTFEINTFTHPIIIPGIIDTTNSDTITITIPNNLPDTLQYFCAYSCNHPNNQNHNCWMIDPFHDFNAGNLVVINTGTTNVSETATAFNYALYQNYPNPFNPSTKIKYSLKSASHVSLNIYNAIGKELFTLINETQSSGFHEFSFNAQNLPSGIYYYRIQADNFIQIKKMILLK